MPVGAVAGAAGLGGALISSSAAKSAAKTQANAATTAGQYQLEAANRAADLQLQMYNQTRNDLAPYRQMGSTYLPGLSALLGGSTGINTAATPTTTGYGEYVQNNKDLLDYYNANKNNGAEFWNYWGLQGTPTMEQFGQAHWNSNPTENATRGYTPQTAIDAQKASQTAAQSGTGTEGIQAYLESLPGYQFARDQGIQAVTNQLNARGLGDMSGSLSKGIARFVTGLADQTYGDQVNRLMSAVGMGQNAAAQTGTLSSNAASGASNALIGGSQAYGQGIIGAANASAGGTVGAANAISSGLGSLGNAYLTSQILGGYGKTSQPTRTYSYGPQV